MKRLGLMGFGAVAQYGHRPAILATPDLVLHAVFDPDPGRRDQARAAGVPHVHGELEPFFATGLDGVVIASPAPRHLENVLACAARRLPVLCEKPIASTEADAEAAVGAMREAGAFLATAFCYRFSPCAIEIRRMVRERVIGEVRSMRLVYNWGVHGKYLPGPGAALNLRRHDRMLEGGPMVDCGVHQIDLARWWLGLEVDRQRAVGAWVESYEAPDHIYLHLEFAGGVQVLVEMSYSFGHTAAEPVAHYVYELIGTDGVIRYDREARRFEVRTASGTTELPWHEEKHFVGMYGAFADALATGRLGDLPDADDGVTATRIARRATEDAIAAAGRAAVRG